MLLFNDKPSELKRLLCPAAACIAESIVVLSSLDSMNFDFVLVHYTNM